MSPAPSDLTACACGCLRTFPAKPGRKFYDAACRRRAARARKIDKVLARVREALIEEGF